jgi:hypothetical protein
VTAVSGTRLRAVLPRAWAVVLVVLLLGPALGWGYVLSYDMVFVPRLALRSDFWGLGSGLPRAVPSDAVVALLNTVLPGMLLQKLALVGALLGAAEGALRLVGRSTAARMTAVSVAIWNPFVAERLGMGHWTVLLGYAAVPWLVLAGRRARETGTVPARLGLLLPLGSLSASAGVVSALVLLVTGWRRGPGSWRHRSALLGLSVAANAPWLVTGFVHASAASAPAHTDLFGAHREGDVPAPLALLTLGGIWNAEVVPHTRTGVLGWLALVVLAGLAALGARQWWRRTGRDEAGRLLALAGLGYLLALVTWLSPGGVDWLANHLPGAGLLRDGTRSLALVLPVYVGVLAAGAEAMRDRVVGTPARAAAVVACCLLPLALLPDVRWGLGGGLHAVSYPASWAEARQRVDTGKGDVLVLPFSGYRAPEWNRFRTVIDPLGRYLRPDYLVNDELVVSGLVVPTQDPRVPEAKRALALRDPAARSAALSRIGVGYVALERDVLRSEQPGVAGATVLDRPDLLVTRLHGAPHETVPSTAARASTTVAWIAFAAVPVICATLRLRRRRSR